MPSANPAPSQDVEGVNTAPDAAPRPPTPDEIVAMMDAAVQQKTNEEDTEEIEGKRRDGIGVSLILFWFGIGATIAAVGYIVFASGESGVSSLALAGALAFLVALFVAGAAIKTVSPSLIAGAMMRRAAGAGPVRSAKLAGAEILNALGLAEPVIEADPDATLITRRDGVVSYANDAYFTLAADAGVMGAAGLPPRIDRLFAQQGTEATKVFRLCRAAKSGVAAEETVSQLMGVSGGGRRRRFVLSVAPIESAPEFVVWRLRELPEEEEQQDILASAYADFPRPVFALERSGQILWANAAMRTRLNADRNGLRRLEDVALGDTDDLARSLWRVDQTPQSAVFRRANQEPVEAQLTAFRRGGLGEGFVCVDAALDDEEPEVDNDALSGDMSESPFGVAVVEGEVNRDGRIVEANKAFAEVFGAAGKNTPLAKVLPPAALEELSTEIKRKSRGGPAPVEATLGTGSQARSYALYPRPVRRRRGAYGSRRLFLYSVDITDRKRMEVDVAQDQKLRGIGELASKVAHDFNNYLQVVLGHCERLMLKHPAGDPAYGDLVQIRENAQRAANTTKQLLAFSRKQTLTREVLSITEILRDFSRFLTRAIGEKVTLELVNGRGLPPVKVDRYQLESAIMNLAVNARDAMGADGGAFTIRTRLITAEEALGLSVPGLKEQDYVLIEAADTGPGVPPEIVDKVFDPFFTTKDMGKGTGLGLSTVYGVIRQMGGAVGLESSPENGATFQLFLPAVEEEIQTSQESAPAAADPQDLTGAGRILIVEDEDPVRAFVRAALTDCGYQVVEAEDGEDALDVIKDEDGEFDLIISDVMMPVMDGPTAIQHARADLNLESKVLFMSAYAEAAVQEQLSAIDDAAYIQKPFTLKGIAGKVKQLLYEPDGRQEAQ